MKYYVQEKDGITYECNNWWDLITFFYEGNTRNDFHRDYKIDDIAHNSNDVCAYWEMTFNRNPDEYIDYNEEIVKEAKRLLVGLLEDFKYQPNKRHVSEMRYVVFDELNRIINKRDIQEAFREYDSKKAERTYYRPMYSKRVTAYGFSGNRHRHRRRNVRSGNKKYVAELQEYIELFPSDARLRDVSYRLGWWDDYGRRSKGRTWKDQSKKKKQWM